MFQRMMGATGIFLFVCPLFFLAAPSFWPMEMDRELIFSGTSVRFWDKVKPLLKPGEVVVPVMNPNLSVLDVYLTPYSLLAAYNYPELLQVRSGVGYLLTVPDDQLYLKTYPPSSSGAYLPEQEATVLAERPNVRFVTLESLKPLRITLSSPQGPIDLTPLLGEP
jgi:hypothetical protein